MSTEFVDPYVDPESGVLRNLVGAHMKVALQEAEGDLSFARLVQLLEHPVPMTGDLAEWCAIHRHLFQDVFEWAGRIRMIDFRKSAEGAKPFQPVFMIESAAEFVASELRADAMLKGLDRGRFIERPAHHYDQWNHVHPLRDGNGRTQRVFWGRIAADAGWPVGLARSARPGQR